MSAKRVVLTGYEPWSHAAENPTLELLDRARERNFPDVELITLRVPVDSEGITPLVEGVHVRVEPHAIRLRHSVPNHRKSIVTGIGISACHLALCETYYQGKAERNNCLAATHVDASRMK